MKITDIKTFLVHPGRGKNWLLVKVDTDEGLFGWGECYTQADRDRAIEVHVQAMRRYLIGRSPFDIKHTVGVMYHDWAGRRGAMEFDSPRAPEGRRCRKRSAPMSRSSLRSVASSCRCTRFAWHVPSI